MPLTSSPPYNSPRTVTTMNVRQLKQECEDLIRSGKGECMVIVKSLAPYRSKEFTYPVPHSPIAKLGKLGRTPYVEAILC